MSIHPAMRPVRRMVQCEGIVSLAMPCYELTLVVIKQCKSVSITSPTGIITHSRRDKFRQNCVSFFFFFWRCIRMKNILIKRDKQKTMYNLVSFEMSVFQARQGKRRTGSTSLGKTRHSYIVSGYKFIFYEKCATKTSLLNCN